jgi:hypothetical protein
MSGGCVGNTSPGKLGFLVGASAGNEACSGKTYNDNQWHHVMGVHKPGQYTYIYVDGALAGQASLPAASPPTNTSAFTIGRRDYPGAPLYYSGQIDDVRLYNYVMSLSQIKKIMNEGASVRFGPSTGSP